MRSCCRLPFILILFCFVAVGLFAVPDTAECRKKVGPPLLEVYTLPTGTGGGLAKAMTKGYGSTFLIAGQARDTGGPWQACLWPVLNDLSGGCTYELLPSLDPTKAAAANDLIMWFLTTGGGPDTSIVATGYSYDSMDRIRPMLWSRGICDTVYMYEELPTLAGNEGEARGIIQRFDHDLDGNLCAFGWSEGVATNKAVIWTDNGSGGWAVRTLPHDGPGYAGCALDGKGGDLADTVLVGWTETAVGDTIPVVWENDGGGWTKTILPLPMGAIKGQAVTFGTSQEGTEEDIVGWTENVSGERKTAVWSNPGTGWEVEQLTILVGYDKCEPLGVIFDEQKQDGHIVGKSYDPGQPVGTIWGIVDDYTRNDFTRDINELILTDLAPTIREAVAVIESPAELLLIAANGVEAQPGGYGVAQSSTPQAYVLVETEVVPAIGSYRGVTLLVVVLCVLGSLLMIRRKQTSRALRV